MLKLFLVFILLARPVFAQDAIHPAIDSKHLNAYVHLASLVRTDRNPRSWKTLWLKPGRPKFWYYEWVMQDGSIATKVETKQIKGIPDRREFSDSHPDLALILAPIQFIGVGTAIGLTAYKL
jgi:hypothetical protein